MATKARAMLMRAQLKAQEELQDQYEDIMNRNQAAADASFWGGLAGQLGLPAVAALGKSALENLGLVAAPETAGMSILATSLLSALGSRLFSEVAEHGGIEEAWEQTGGVRAEGLKSTGFGGARRRELEQSIENAWGGFGEKQSMDAIQAGISAAIMGNIKGAYAATGTGVDELGFAYAEDMMPSSFDRIGQTLGTTWQFDPVAAFGEYQKKTQKGQYS